MPQAEPARTSSPARLRRELVRTACHITQGDTHNEVAHPIGIQHYGQPGWTVRGRDYDDSPVWHNVRKVAEASLRTGKRSGG